MAAPLIGRDVDLAQLMEAFHSAQAGRLAAVVLCGEAGAGKTRLVRVGPAGRRAGAAVLRGGALDIAEARRSGRRVRAARAASPTGPAAAAPGAVDRRSWPPARPGECPATGAAAGPRADPGAGPSGRRRLAARSVLVLVLEDLQWVDRLHARPARLPDRQPGWPSPCCCSDLPQRGPPRTSATRRLHRRAAAAPAGALRRGPAAAPRRGGPDRRAAAPGRPELAELVWSRSAGNAFIVGETLRAALEGEPHALPQTLRTSCCRGWRRCRRSRSASSGRSRPRTARCRTALLAAVADAQQVAEPELLDALREGVDRGVVVVDEGVSGEGYRLRHGLMAEVVAGGLLPGERMALHRALRHRAGGGPGARAARRGRPDGAPLAAGRRPAAGAGRPRSRRHAPPPACTATPRRTGTGCAPRCWPVTWPRRPASAGPSRERVPGARRREAAHLAGDHDQAVALLAERLAEHAARAESRRRGGHRAAARPHRALPGRGGPRVEAAARLPPGDGAAAGGRERPGSGPRCWAGRRRRCCTRGSTRRRRRSRARRWRWSARSGPAGEEATVLATLGFGLAYLEDTAAGLGGAGRGGGGGGAGRRPRRTSPGPTSTSPSCCPGR